MALQMQLHMLLHTLKYWLATTDIVNDLNQLATTDFVSDLNAVKEAPTTSLNQKQM